MPRGLAEIEQADGGPDLFRAVCPCPISPENAQPQPAEKRDKPEDVVLSDAKKNFRNANRRSRLDGGSLSEMRLH